MSNRHPSTSPSKKPAGPIPNGASICHLNNGATLQSTAKTICLAYKNVRTSFNALISGAYNKGNPLAQSNLFGQAIRVAFHDAAEIDITQSDKMGPDGCLSDTAANNGLLLPTSLILSVLEPIWQQNCDKISRADFWVMFAHLAIQYADPTGSINIPYQFGRVDTTSCSAGSNRLPEAQNAKQAIKQVFGTQMGFSLAQTGLAFPVYLNKQ